jgi:hypothetical protein
MLKSPLYLAYGAMLLGLSGWMQTRGTSFSDVTELKNVPRSVRDNPGVYRSHYSYLPRWFRGK